MDLSYDHYCFGCGEKNPHGLKLKFTYDGTTVKTVFTPGPMQQGYPGIMHGGLTSTILDEVMSRCINALGHIGVTARLEVRFRDSIPLNAPVYFEAWITNKRGRIVDTEAKAALEDGKLVADGKARFMIIQEATSSTGHPTT